MSRLSLGAAVLMLWAGMIIAKTPAAAVRANQDPAGNAQTDTAYDRVRTSDAGEPIHMVEGCLTSNDDAFTLIDAQGRTYQLSGDTAQLTARAGSHVRLWGHHDSITDAEELTAGQPLRSFHVLRARSTSSGCGTARA